MIIIIRVFEYLTDSEVIMMDSGILPIEARMRLMIMGLGPIPLTMTCTRDE